MASTLLPIATKPALLPSLTVVYSSMSSRPLGSRWATVKQEIPLPAGELDSLRNLFRRLGSDGVRPSQSAPLVKRLVGKRLCAYSAPDDAFSIHGERDVRGKLRRLHHTRPNRASPLNALSGKPLQNIDPLRQLSPHTQPCYRGAKESGIAIVTWKSSPLRQAADIASVKSLSPKSVT